MPSTTSTSVPKLWPSSTSMTPSRPTLSIASAMSLPISGSRAETDATCAISALPLIGVASSLIRATTLSLADMMPFLRATGLAPAATILSPSSIIA